jgi:hypothetical protein
MGREGRFITLRTLEMDSGEYTDVLEARHLVTLAETLFTVWLGALAEMKGDAGSLRSHCPRENNLSYSDAHPTILLLRMLQFPAFRSSQGFVQWSICGELMSCSEANLTTEGRQDHWRYH